MLQKQLLFFKHPPELKVKSSQEEGQNGGGGRRSNRNGRSGGGNGENRLDLMEATLSSVLEAVKKLTSYQVNNNIQGTNNLNQAGVWLSQKSKVKGD